MDFDLTQPFDVTPKIQEKLGEIILLLNGHDIVLKVKEDKFGIIGLKRKIFNILDCLEV
jgi:hypothetical protein